MTKLRADTCKAHCSACGRHFTSTRAFEMHRVGEFDPFTRRCEAPFDVVDESGAGRLEIRSSRAECRMYAETASGAVLWGEAGVRERLAQVFHPSGSEDVDE